MAETGEGISIADKILASVKRKQELALHAGQTTPEQVLEAVSAKKKAREDPTGGKFSARVIEEGPEMTTNRILAGVYRAQHEAKNPEEPAKIDHPTAPAKVSPDTVVKMIKKVREL